MKVADLLEEKTYCDGEMIIEEGENGDCFYIVENGKVICLQKYEDDKPPGCVATLSPGDYFGERALLLDCRRACTVTAGTYFDLIMSKIIGGIIYSWER